MMRCLLLLAALPLAACGEERQATPPPTPAGEEARALAEAEAMLAERAPPVPAQAEAELSAGPAR